jgi:hypothetical protein
MQFMNSTFLPVRSFHIPRDFIEFQNIFCFYQGASVTVRWFSLLLAFFISTLSINYAMALPIDWSGVFGADTHMLSNTCKSADDITKPVGARNGTQGITSDCNASFQTYVFKLNPQIIVNDAVTLKGELSSGYTRGGFAGDNPNGNSSEERLGCHTRYDWEIE